MVLAAWLTASCGSGTSNRPSLVVLVLVDTLRAESLPAYGYGRDTAPFLSRLAERSVLFENVHSQASCTLPSVNSILASRYPADFLVGATATRGVRHDLPTIASIFREAGYATLAVSASPVVTATPSQYHDGVFGIGFDDFLEQCVGGAAACVTEAALDVVAAASSPLFLYLHYFDPHDPYAPPDHGERFFDSTTAPPVRDWAARGMPNDLAEAIDGMTDPIPYDDADVTRLVDLYDAEISYLDGQLERLFAGLDQLGRSIDAVVAIGSDHGEQFLEHGRLKHCKSVYEPETRVPLIMTIPSAPPRRVRRAVQNLDITPTLLDAAGLRWRNQGLAGQSLMPLVREGEIPGGWSYSLQNSQRALSRDRYKLVFDTATEQYEVYDLERDPAESVDLSTSEPEVLEAMVIQLRQVMGRADEAVGDPARTSRLLRRAEARLRALGYLR
jgi:arylsulfatase A-like enzyme